MIISGTVNFKGNDLWVEAIVEKMDYSNAHSVEFLEIEYKGVSVKDLVLDTLLDSHQLDQLDDLVLDLAGERDEHDFMD